MAEIDEKWRRRPPRSRRCRFASRRRTCAWSRQRSSGSRPPSPRSTTIPGRDRPTHPELAELMVDRCLDVLSPAGRSRCALAARATARRGGGARDRPPRGRIRCPGSTGGRSGSAPTSSGRSRRRWSCSASCRPIERYQVEQEDARLTIRAPEDVHAGAQLDPERPEAAPAGRRARQPARPRARSCALGARRVPDGGRGGTGGHVTRGAHGVRLRRLPAGLGCAEEQRMAGRRR